jgi:hypothetical protein
MEKDLKMLRLIIISVITLNFANAKDWSKTICPDNPKVFAKELVTYWLAGPNVTMKSKCLDHLESKLKYVPVDHNPPVEVVQKVEEFLASPYEEVIDEVKKTEEYEYTVKFHVKHKNGVYRDEFDFRIIPLRSTHKYRQAPCAIMQTEPAKVVMLRKCL